MKLIPHGMITQRLKKVFSCLVDLLGPYGDRGNLSLMLPERFSARWLQHE